MIYCFDLDETLCSTIGENYADAKPKVSRIEVVKTLFREGHIIKIHTARGTKTGIDWRLVTENQLRDWGVPHHDLQLGKPFADIYVDDKGCLDTDFFGE